MVCQLLGRLHAAIAGARLRGSAGQGTVEYVALILLVAAVLGSVVVATRSAHIGAPEIARAIVGKIRDAVQGVR